MAFDVIIGRSLMLKNGLLAKAKKTSKVEKISEDSLDSFPSPSVKIQIIGGKVYLKYYGKTLLVDVKIFLF